MNELSTLKPYLEKNCHSWLRHGWGENFVPPSYPNCKGSLLHIGTYKLTIDLFLQGIPQAILKYLGNSSPWATAAPADGNNMSNLMGSRATQEDSTQNFHKFPNPIVNLDFHMKTAPVESVEDFLIKLDMKPCMHIVETSMSSSDLPKL